MKLYIRFLADENESEAKADQDGREPVAGCLTMKISLALQPIQQNSNSSHGCETNKRQNNMSTLILQRTPSIPTTGEDGVQSNLYEVF